MNSVQKGNQSFDGSQQKFRYHQSLNKQSLSQHKYTDFSETRKMDCLRKRYMQIQKNYSNNSKNLSKSLGIELMKSKNSEHGSHEQNKYQFSHQISFQRENQMQNQGFKIQNDEQLLPKINQRQSQINRSFATNYDQKYYQQHGVRNKYFSLSNQLKSINHSELIQILLQEIQDNQKNKSQLFKKNNQIMALNQQVCDLKVILQQKRQAISVLCINQSKNLTILQKMQIELKHKESTKTKQGIYQQKYGQLSLHMDEYINTMNQAQQQFKRKLIMLTKENKRLSDLSQSLNDQINQQFKKCELVFQANKAMEKSLQQSQNLIIQLSDKNQKLMEYFNQNQILKQKNQILIQKNQFQKNLNQQLKGKIKKLEYQINQINVTVKDTIQTMRQADSQYLNLQTQNKELSEKIAQYEQLKTALNEQRQKNQKNNKQKDNQILSLSSQLQKLKQDKQILISKIEDLQTQNKELTFIQQELMNQYERERLGKQKIKKQLIQLKQKVEFMQQTYKNQVSKSSLIKNQLQKYWQTKLSHEQYSFSTTSRSTLINPMLFKQNNSQQKEIFQASPLCNNNKYNLINAKGKQVNQSQKVLINNKKRNKINQKQKQNILNQ